jgi:hypothetical protein
MANDLSDISDILGAKGDVSDVSGILGAPEQKQKEPLSAAAYIGKVRSDPEIKKQMSSALGRATAHFLTTGGGLGEVGVPPFLGEEEYKKYIQPYVGETPKEYQRLQNLLEMTPIFFGAAKISPKTPEFAAPKAQTQLEKALGSVQFTSEQLAAAAKKKAGETLTASEEKALSDAVSAVDRQLNRIPGLKEVTSKTIPEDEVLRTASRSEAKLAKPDLEAERLSKTDIESRINDLASKKLARAQAVQFVVGTTRFQSFEDVANVRQKTNPFHTSEVGQRYLTQLDNIIEGGEGEFRNFSTEQSDAARKLKNLINPESGKPASWKLIDQELEKIRSKQEAKDITGVDRIDRQRWKQIGDGLENAIESWVGKENYPRQSYRIASEDKNKFAIKLGQALTEREEILFSREKGMKDVARPSEILFDSRESVYFGKELLGEQEVNALAEQHASNVIKDMNASDIRKWLDSGRSEFVSEIPGLSEKINTYAQSLAQREGDMKAFAELQRQAKEKIGEAQKAITGAKGEAVTATKQAKQAYDTAVNLSDKMVRTLQNEDPAKLYKSFANLRPELEASGAFDKTALDEIEAQIGEASKIANAQERAAAIQQAIGSQLKKYAIKYGIPVGALGAIGTAGYKYVTGD